MCGICGVITGIISKGEADNFLKLLFMSSFRGLDSTGVMGIKEDKKQFVVSMLKSATNPLNFYEQHKDAFDKHIHTSDSKAIIGHTRAATKGTIVRKNAHPFDTPRFVGVHNGGFFGDVLKLKDKDCETDSEQFYWYLNQHGLQDTLQEVNQESCAFALAFYDKREKTLNFIRNDKRPLHFAPVMGGNTIYVASESSFLRFVLDRDRTAVKEVYTIKPWHLLKYDMTRRNPALHFDIQEIKVKPKVNPVVSHWRRHDAEFFQSIGQDIEHREPSEYEAWWNTKETPHHGSHSSNIRRLQHTPYPTNVVRTDVNNPNKAIAMVFDPETRRFIPETQRSAITEEDQNQTEIKKSHQPASGNSQTDSDMEETRRSVDRSDEQEPTGNRFYWIGTRGLTYDEYQELLEDGCINCAEQALHEDKVEWMNNREYFCESCKDLEDVQQYKPFYKSAAV
jgi:hypothetical protein